MLRETFVITSLHLTSTIFFTETRHLNRPSENPPAQPPTDVVATEKVKIKTKVKSSSKKTMNKDSKGREGVVNPPPSLPVSLTLETPIAEAGSSKVCYFLLWR